MPRQPDFIRRKKAVYHFAHTTHFPFPLLTGHAEKMPYMIAKHVRYGDSSPYTIVVAYGESCPSCLFIYSMRIATSLHERQYT